MATLVASSSSSSGSPSSAAAPSTPTTGSGPTASNQSPPPSSSPKSPTSPALPPNTRMESVTNEDEVIEFLREHFVAKEPILSSLHISKIDEITVLLTDVVHDCVSCPASSVIRDSQSNELLGVCLSSRATLFEKQMDRLFCYEFTDPQLRIAIDFLKIRFQSG
ncbi:hypothetical protein OSTOST_25996 [Ostertagia ostertagi]